MDRERTETMYPIGVLAQKADTKIVTICYYERIGLLPSAERTQNNYRLYGAITLQRLQFIRQCRALGFPLKEIKDLFDLSSKEGFSRHDVQALARLRLQSLEAERRRIEAQCVQLQRLIDECPNGAISGCGIIDGLKDALK